MMIDLTNIQSYSDLPMNDACREAVRAFFTEGRHPGSGSFVEAVLENDLKETFKRADDLHLTTMYGIVHWMYLHAPIEFYGSRRRVARHCARMAQVRTVARLGVEWICKNCGWRTMVDPKRSPKMGMEEAHDNVYSQGTEEARCAVCGIEEKTMINRKDASDREYVEVYLRHYRRLTDTEREPWEDER